MDDAVVALARRQHWVVARRQLIGLGLGRRAITHRLATGRFHRLHHGVYAVGRPEVTLRGRWLAAVLACGSGALLSHQSAAALWGLIGAGGAVVHVLSERRWEGQDAGIAAHRTRDLAHGDRVTRDRIPVTSIPRTLLDLAGVVDASRLRNAFEEADRLGVLELRAVAEVCGRVRGHKGVGELRSLVGEAAAPEYTRSAFEEAFRDFCRDHALPLPEANAWALGFEVDAIWRAERVIVELDGWEFHRGRAAFERDRERAARLEVAGYLVYRLTYRRLMREPLVVAAELRRALNRRRGS